MSPHHSNTLAHPCCLSHWFSPNWTFLFRFSFTWLERSLITQPGNFPLHFYSLFSGTRRVSINHTRSLSLRFCYSRGAKIWLNARLCMYVRACNTFNFLLFDDQSRTLSPLLAVLFPKVMYVNMFSITTVSLSVYLSLEVFLQFKFVIFALHCVPESRHLLYTVLINSQKLLPFLLGSSTHVS